MHNKIAAVAICIVVYAMSAAAQTAVTTSGTTSSGTVPVFNGAATVTNSPISVSGGNVGIGTTSLSQLLTVGSSGGDSIYSAGAIGIGANPIGWNNPLYVVTSNGEGTPAFPIGGPVFQNNNASYGAALTILGGKTSYGALFFGDATAQKLGAIQYDNSAAGNSMVFFTNNTQQMTILSSGSVGIGTTAPATNHKLEVNGNIAMTYNPSNPTSLIFADGTIQQTAYTGTCGADYAEAVDVTGDRTKYEPGDIMVIDPDTPGKFLKSNQAYSTLVAGIYSTKPGFVGRKQPSTPETSATEVPMAMVGRVPTKVSAENGPIKVGDLLVASSTLGRAMKGTDRSLLTGAVIGKALGSLDSGTGVIEVLVTLQ
jgi:hypothetical protein